MTLDTAKATALDMAGRCRVAFVVYRLPMWKAGVFGVIGRERELPHEAEIVERVDPPAAARIDRLF